MDQKIQLSKFYVMFGISARCMKRCAICIDQVLHEGTFLPPNDSEYIIHSIFEFSAAKKSVHGAIISALQNCGIVPVTSVLGGTNSSVSSNQWATPRRNPDNKYYTRLPMEDAELILTIIRRVVTGLDVVKKNGRVSSGYTEYSVPKALFDEMCSRHKPGRLLGTPGIINIGYSGVTMHKF